MQLSEQYIAPVKKIRLRMPSKCKVLFTAKNRFIVLHGGRGSAKSHSVARVLITLATQGKYRILCGREIQLSISDSVHTLLSDIISEMGLDDEFDVQANCIIHLHTGSTFTYSGLHQNIIKKVKSMEAIDILWVEEAQTMSEQSWRVLLPTIRKKGSRIYVTFNPDLEDDPTYVRFIKNTPEDCLLIEMNYYDNPFFNETEMPSELAYTQKYNPSEFDNIWLGKPRTLAEGAILGKEMQKAYDENRIGVFDYDHRHPVFIAMDIGVADPTAIWFGQRIGSRWRMIKYIEGTDESAPYWVKRIKELPYIYGAYFTPHDSRHREFGSGNTPDEVFATHGLTTSPVPEVSKQDRIHAGRLFVNQCEFDAEGCKEGIRVLRNWKWERNLRTGARKQLPVHDWASHGSDAFTYFALSSSMMHVFAPPPDFSDIVSDIA